MKRTTISLPDDLATLAAREAQRRPGSLSEVARQVLAEHLGLQATGPRPLPFANLGSSGHRHTARDLERILADEWAQAADRDRHR